MRWGATPLDDASNSPKAPGPPDTARQLTQAGTALELGRRKGTSPATSSRWLGSSLGRQSGRAAQTAEEALYRLRESGDRAWRRGQLVTNHVATQLLDAA